MYAIIRTGGHQEKVEAGDSITVDLVKQDPGAEIRFKPLLIATDDGAVVSDPKALEADGAVVGTVVQHIRGKKVEFFDYRQKTGHRRGGGHRQPLTLVQITEIRLGDAADTAEAASERAEAERKEAEAAQEKAAAEIEERKAAPKARGGAKKAPARKPAAKKAPAAKKPAAKKAPAKKAPAKKKTEKPSEE